MRDAETMVARVTDVASVAVPVADQDRAVCFYVEKLGFEVRLDVPTPDGHRWVQVAAPGGRVAITSSWAPTAPGQPSTPVSHWPRVMPRTTTRRFVRPASTPTMCCAGRARPPCSRSETRTATDSRSWRARARRPLARRRSRTCTNQSSPERSRKVRLHVSDDRTILE
jgi:hypothetical protein